jgi:hypothetical protein
VCLAAVGWRAGIVAFEFAGGLPLALAGLCFAGAADTGVRVVPRGHLNRTIPDHLRGQLAGIEQVSYSTGPLLGNVESGVVASLAGLRASVVSGGVPCMAGGGGDVAMLPTFWRHLDAPTVGVRSHGSSSAAG